MNSTVEARVTRRSSSTSVTGQSRTAAVCSEKITNEQLKRLAVVYVRQSTQQQVLEHRESTERQYALADRAVELGWPTTAVEVIDEDQGRSGSSVEGRSGFQRLLAEVSSDRVGIILGLEMSRLARSCKDWHALLELCAIYRTLLADADGLYDPSHYNDRLLLGLKGTMSEAELHVLKSRLHQGMRNKAARGEVLNHPPIGYVCSSSARDGLGDYVIDPDEQVQATVRMVFEQYRRHASVNGLLRWLVRNNVKIPVRPHFGSNRGELEWRRVNRVTLANMLRHPIYAGAYRWGYREIDPRKKVAGKSGTGRKVKAIEDCRVLIRDRFAAYITWEEFERNQQMLKQNSTSRAPRHGPSVLAGLLVCGRCGYRMLVEYANVSSQKTLRYTCDRYQIEYAAEECQSLSGATLESFVVDRMLEAVSPASLELSMAATKDIERERKKLDDHWQQRLVRSQYTVDQARRQYDAVDPEHRLVAHELERRWNGALQSDEQLRADYARFRKDRPTQLSAEEREQILTLSHDLPTLWNADSTTPEDRQTIARLLLDQVIVNVEGNTERVDIELRWSGGFSSRHTLIRPVQTYKQLSNYDELAARVKNLRARGKSLAEIASTLNSEGFHPPKRASKFSKEMVCCFLREQQAQAGVMSTLNDEHLETDEWWIPDLAAKLSIPIVTLHRWRRVGWVTARKVSIGRARWAIYANPNELARLRRLRDARRGWPEPYPKELTTPQK
mgnify:CR=1 FL=1